MGDRKEMDETEYAKCCKKTYLLLAQLHAIYLLAVRYGGCEDILTLAEEEYTKRRRIRRVLFKMY